MTKNEWNNFDVSMGDKVKVTKKDGTIIMGILGMDTDIPKLGIYQLNIKEGNTSVRVNLENIVTFEVLRVIEENHPAY